MYKVIPVRPFDLDGLQCWLEECAQEGLRPVRLGTYLCRMKRAEPRAVRYRLEPDQKDCPPDEVAQLLALYREAGWEFVCPVNSAYLFATEDPDAPEPYTDRSSRADSLRWLDQRLRDWAWYSLAVWGFLAVMFAAVLVMRPAAFLWCLIRFHVSGLIAAAWIMFDAVGDWWMVKRVRAALAAGDDPPRWKRRTGKSTAAKMALTALCLAVLGVNFAVDRLEHPLSAGHAPSLTAREVTRPLTYTGGTLKYQGFSLLAPVQELSQAEGTGEQIPHGTQLPSTVNRFYTPDLETAYYRTIPFLTRPLALSQMEMFRIQNLEWTFREVEYPGADFVILAQSGTSFQMAAAARGGRLVVYQYNGCEDLGQHLALLTAPVL